MKIKLIKILLAAVLLFNMTAFKSIAAANVSASFDILSGSSHTVTGESFTVTVTAKDVRDMYACEVCLTFDNSLLQYAGIVSDIQGYKILPKADQVRDKIIFAVAKTGGQLPENGDVPLCTLTFTGMKEGNARVTLNTVKLMDDILKAADYSLEKTIEVSISRKDTSPTPTPSSAPSTVQVNGYTARILSSDGSLAEIAPVEIDKATGIARVDLEEMADSIFPREGISVIKVPPIPGAKAYTLGIPGDRLSGALGTGRLNFSTEIGGITIPCNMLTGVMEALGKDIGITLGSGDKLSLPGELKEAIGDRPLVQLTLTLDGVRNEWDNPNAPVTVSIPYTPTAEELVDPEHIVVWYIDGKGDVVSVPSGRYNIETGTVTFTVTHFSYYAIAYVHKTFDDLDGVAWAKKAIDVMSSKGIIKGTGVNTYSPALNITRADYLLLLVRTLGLWTEAGDNFDDVKPGTYYYEAIGIARKLGITQGVGNNCFLPGEPIVRQDMMVLTAKAMKIAGKLDQADNPAVLDDFTDKNQLASYAAEPAAALAEAGLIAESNNRIYPMSNTTRAEAAVLMYKIY